MSDLNDQLRSYIDGLEEPVSVDETMTRKSGGRYRVPAAVLAGAAIVLLPALVLIGLRWLPGGDEIAEPTTVPPVVTTTTTTMTPEPTTSTVPPAASVRVPDIVGLMESDARTKLRDLGLQMTVAETYFYRTDIGTVRSQWPEPGDEAAAGSDIAVGIAVLPDCVNWMPDSSEPTADETQITVLFECAGGGPFPGDWTPLTRTIPATADVIEAMIKSLLAGPTEAERAAGFSSFFSTRSADALNSVALQGSRLTVDFNDAIVLNNVSTSTGSTYFIAELRVNLFQFGAVDTIEFSINGDCGSFGGMMEIGECLAWTRVEWNAQLEEWDDALEEMSSPTPEVDPKDLVGVAFIGDPDSDAILTIHTGGGLNSETGFNEMSTWPLDDTAADPETGSDWAFHVAGTETEMIWLVRIQQQTDDGLIYTVRAALKLPWDEIMPVLNADAFLMNGRDECTINQEQDPLIVAIGELTLIDEKVTGATTLLRAWRIDIEGAGFEEIPLDDIVCISDTF